jgi:hypothetical protein
MKTMAVEAQGFVTNAAGKRTGVLLDLKTYERLREAEEELADIRAYDAARPVALAELRAGRYSTLADCRAKGARTAR